MATKLTKALKRETEIMYDGVPVIVILDPGINGNAVLHFRGKGKKWQVSLPVLDAFDGAMNAADRLSPDEIATLRNTKAKIMVNPNYSPTESQAICDTIDAQVATTESINGIDEPEKIDAD